MTTPEKPFEFCPVCGEKMKWMLVPLIPRHNNDCPKGCIAIDVLLGGKVMSNRYGDSESVDEFRRKLKLQAFE